MKKTTSIGLSNQNFILEEDAYQKLDEYLTEIKKYFEENPDKAEIIEDIENSIAQKFYSRLNNNKQIINLKEVDDVIKSLGSIADFSEAEGGKKYTSPKEPESVKTPGKKKLFRDTDNKIIAGVCSGLGAYFGCDPVWVRVIFILPFLFPHVLMPANIVAYIFFWIAMPPATTKAEKLQMRGEAVNLSNIKDSVALDHNKNVQRGESFIKKLAHVVLTLFLVLLRIIAVFIVFIGGIIIFSVTVWIIGLFMATLFNVETSSVDASILSLPRDGFFYFGSLSVFVFSLIAGIFILALGMSILKRKYIFNTFTTLTLIGLFIIAVMGTGFSVAKFGPEVKNNWMKNQITKEYPLSGFSKVQVSGSKKVIIKSGPDFKVSLSGNRSIVEKADFRVVNSELQLEDGFNGFRFCILCFGDDETLEVTMPTLEGVELMGSISATASGFHDLSELTIDVSGSSDLSLEEGNSQKLMGEVSGASLLNARNFEAIEGDFDISGASSAAVFITGHLKADASGASELQYKGNPETQFESTGASEIRPLEGRR